jgi:hypothetical protein
MHVVAMAVKKGGRKGAQVILVRRPRRHDPDPNPSQPPTTTTSLPPHRSISVAAFDHFVLSCGTRSTSQQREKSLRSIQLENGDRDVESIRVIARVVRRWGLALPKWTARRRLRAGGVLRSDGQ